MRTIYFIICLCFSLSIFSESNLEKEIKNMSLEEKIGQLFMVPACPKRKDSHKKDLLFLLKNYHIGSVIVKSSDPYSQVCFLNLLQKKVKKPLLVGIDAENGLGMRMEQTISFPMNLTLGAIEEKEIIYQLGKEVGKQCRRVGAHINFAPVCDVNSNPLNPIIHMRSFGDDPYLVAVNSIYYMRGIQDENVLACAKHFPGHGDAVTDSHCDLPILDHDLKKLEGIHLFPFSKLIGNNISCIMSAHLLFPNLCDTPTSLSKEFLTNILRKKMNFSGLIIADALNMKALSKTYTPEQIALLAFGAGNDILLYGDHIEPNVDDILQRQVPLAFAALKDVFEKKVLDVEVLNAKVLKILRAKEKLGLFKNRYVDENNLEEDLFSENALMLERELFQKAITFVGEEFVLNKHMNVNCICFNEEKYSFFIDQLKQNLPLVSVVEKEKVSLLDKEFFTLVVLGLEYKMKNYGLSEDEVDLIQNLSQKNDKIAFVIFGTPYSLKWFGEKTRILMAYEHRLSSQKAALKVLLGRKKATGKLPVKIKRGW